MKEWKYRRAQYDEERQAYIVSHDDGSEALYSFVCLEPDEDELHSTLALLKQWEDEEGDMGELYSFMILDQPEKYEEAAADILTNGREAALEENVDEFLAVIDVVKRRAIEADLDDESIELLEGLFETGPADAYTQREYDPDRLHHHVERPNDECWRIEVARAVAVDDATGELGWVCYVIQYPELTSAASEMEIQQAQYAELLDLEHHIDEVGAHVAAVHLRKFMLEGDRVQNPDYAYMNDTMVFEFISVLSRDENEHCPDWHIFSAEELQAFRQNPVLHRKVWYPRDLFRELAEATDISLAHADQYAAMWRDLMDIEPQPFKEDSPFRDLKL